MSLRLRLVVGLALLLTAGLAVFGVATYSVYSNSEYGRLDERLRNTNGRIIPTLLDAAGLIPGPGFGGAERPGGGFFDGYAEIRDATGTVLATDPEAPTSVPDLPDALPKDGSFLTVGSSTGSGEWRVYVQSFRDQSDGAVYEVAIAVPTDQVQESLNRLVLIEAIGGGSLLVLLAVGSWFLLRRGLRPLEDMADSARSITEGDLDLSQRVAPADGRSEVGQLGLALNTMLGGIETAFTEREATEQRLRQFLSDASHELRTPLTSIQGFAELFRLDQQGTQIDRGTVVRRIEEESARMRVLVDDLLLLARLDETRPRDTVPVDLTVLAADACTDAAATAPDRRITLHAPEPVVVAGDGDHLRQAIANLVTNALKHTPAGSPVDVSVDWKDRTARLEVRDHGSGLDEASLAHVFDRFWRADQARVGAGSGLGLSIVSAIAAEHHGEARATNHPDGGAVFTLELPVLLPPGP